MRSIIAISILFLLSCSKGTPKEGHISSGKLKIYFERIGKGGPIILLHGGFLDSRMWAEQVKALRNDHELIVIDLPGHGRSEGKDTNHLFKDVMTTVMDSLQIDKAIIMGLSLGSASALEFAVNKPERVKALIMLAPGIPGWETKYPIDTGVLNGFGKMMSFIEVKDTAAAAEQFTRMWADGPARTPDQTPAEVRKQVKTNVLETMRTHKIEGWPRFDARSPAIDALDRISFPAMIVYGDIDAITCIQAAQELGKRVKNAKVHALSGVAHMVNMEKPDSVNLFISNFIKTIK